MKNNNNFFSFKDFITTIALVVIIAIFTLPINVFAKDNKPIHCVDRDDKKISLTFDVNWAENDYLYEILDLLDENNIKATFFIMGKWVIYPEGNREKLVEIHKRGHEIGNHSYVHPDFKNIGKERIIEEVKKTEEIIEKEVGVKTNLFRFPSGSYSKESLSAIEGLEYKSIQWDVDSVDWKGESKEKEYKKVVNNVKGGSILLYHNNGKYTVENLKEIIPKLKSEGYEFVKISDIIYENSYEIDDNGKQLLIKTKQNNS
ncbi:polysaccharide deacetylase family sporulation protein PdaB [Clostridium perfringens]|uniref:polysaccharide deacetylase family sporulation protein PdaB n=1 Tax=Clostridium perfringens TaxID=1502 RepID=UPI001F050D11|nr:polysaccharide deacetylase family sporulation protein PdaB [Clostridium perfringens]MCH1963542.1 polysaccharide deacetylase family sporulation protein PdaB [Clostridium perfringens]MDK0978184.1 polysaccharide deacetylase family sporulation protein PdaB [Clostridium perfringens]MDU3017457.1 polysaccharide deacetylase family sporulation protein PdaB [Clostridium perfringens]